MDPRPFLTARWRDLLLVTWPVADRVLLPHLPPGLDLDRWGGSALVSLVAFDFEDTRVRGVRWPPGGSAGGATGARASTR